MTAYCTQINIGKNIRLDLFTPESFRVRVSGLNGNPFPEEYEIPFALGKTIPWEKVEYTYGEGYDSSMLVVKTEKLIIYCRKDTGSFIVEEIGGKRLYPEYAPTYGMFKNHCIVFDSASFHQQESACSRYAHWFYNKVTEQYDICLAENVLLDTFFIFCESYRKGYALFNQIVGSEPMLSYKGYGYYQTQHLGRAGTQKLLLEAAKRLREEKIPCDTLIVDFEWGDGATNGADIPWGSGLDWSSEYKYPYSPAEMVEKLKDMHYDVMLIHHSIPNYKNRFDEGWVCAEVEENLWWDKMQSLLDIGIIGTWQDTRQTDITNARIYSGLQKRIGNGKRCSFLGNYDIYRDSCWTKDCVMTPVKQKIGCRRTPFYWTGDTSQKKWSDLKTQIEAIINENGALKGISYITNDGMRGGGPELAVRMDQFLAFNSVARSHNTKPWESVSSADSLFARMAITAQDSTSLKASLDSDLNKTQENIIRNFLQIRYKLLPYIYTLARETYDTGLPITRPLMIEYEDDDNCNKNQFKTQFMLGSNILVCPVCQNGGFMDVYLPKGERWINYFTGESFDGGQTVQADISDMSTMPLFIKSGAIIPMTEDKYYIDNKKDDKLIINIFGEGKDEFCLYEDDGKSLGYQNGEYSFTKIISDVNKEGAEIIIKTCKGKFDGMPICRDIVISIDGKNIKEFQADYSKEYIIKLTR